MIHTSPPVQVVGRFNPELGNMHAERMFHTLQRQGYADRVDQIALAKSHTLEELRDSIGLEITKDFVPKTLKAEYYQHPFLTRPAPRMWHIEAKRDLALGGMPVEEFAFLIAVSSTPPLLVEGVVSFSSYEPVDPDESWTRPAVDLMYQYGRREVSSALRDPNQSAHLNTDLKPGDVILVEEGTIHAADPRAARRSGSMHRMLLNGFY